MSHIGLHSFSAAKHVDTLVGLGASLWEAFRSFDRDAFISSSSDDGYL
jgi:hypothetical protein